MQNVKLQICFIPIQLKKYVRVCVHIHMYIYVYVQPPMHFCDWTFHQSQNYFLKQIFFCEMEFSLGKLILPTFSYLFQAEQQRTDSLLETAWKAFNTSPSKKTVLWSSMSDSSWERLINLQVLKNLPNNHFRLSQPNAEHIRSWK